MIDDEFNTNIHTCTALYGPDGGGSSWGWGGQYEQWTSSFFLVLPRTALVNRSDVAVTPHTEASRHGQGVHVVHGVHGRLHGLRLHRTVDLLTHLLDLSVQLHLTQLEEAGGPMEKVRSSYSWWTIFITATVQLFKLYFLNTSTGQGQGVIRSVWL